MKKIFALFLVIALLPIQTLAASQHAGKIYLQVEANGEAWYVDPNTEERSYLGRPQDAFNVMRGLGLGISNENLAKIPVAVSLSQGMDTDGDGLSDLLEDALGTDKNSQDSDGDTFTDHGELADGYNPLGAGRLSYDMAFVDSVRGKILLQVEANGEAWYVNPVDGKRYFLGRPADAFAIMRSVGIGITNADLALIRQVDDPVFTDTPMEMSDSVNAVNCGKALLESYKDESASEEERIADMNAFYDVYTCLNDARKDCLVAEGEINNGVQTTLIKTLGEGADCKIYYEITDVFITEVIGMNLTCSTRLGLGLITTMSNYADCEGSLKEQTFPDGEDIPTVQNSSEIISRVNNSQVVLSVSFEWHSDLGVSESNSTITITPEELSFSSGGSSEI